MATPDEMVHILESKGKPLSSFHKGDKIVVSNKMKHDYSYSLEEAPGTNFAEGFKPHFTPGQMLRLGAFEGKYLNDCTDEFPQEWFLMAAGAGRLSPDKRDVGVNYFRVDSRQPLPVWRQNGWAPSPKGSRGGKDSKGRDILADRAANPDERGWFQWYCRYWMGRRIPDLDAVQIGRWRSFARHAGAIRHGCARGTLSCRPRERQALLQWAYNPFI
jgi:hypothetical protein